MTVQPNLGKGVKDARANPARISVVAPAYNESENLPVLFERVREALEGIDVPFQLLVVENGSTDNSIDVLRDMHERDPRLNYIRLSRNFGHQGALTAGMAVAEGDALISMDADLQHPPEVLPEMIAKWREGYDVVIAVANTNATQSLARRIINRIYYSVITGISGLDLRGGLSDFRLMDGSAALVMKSLPERSRYLRGLARWIGFSQTSISYEIAERFRGESKFSLGQLFRFGVDGALAFSILPLRLFLVLGFFVAGSSLLYACYLVMSKLLSDHFGIGENAVSGFTTLAAGIFFLSGTILMGIGILGEYIGRIYDETKARPSYIVWESSLKDPDPESGSDPREAR